MLKSMLKKDKEIEKKKKRTIFIFKKNIFIRLMLLKINSFS